MPGLVCILALTAGEQPGDWSGNYPPCDQHREVLKQEPKNLGIRFSTSDAALAAAFRRAMNFWATILDMKWYEEDSRNCSILIVDGDRGLFQPAEAARAQFPNRPAFQGWIAINRKMVLSESERYLVAVHELGHILGLHHSPNVSSVMYFLRLDGPLFLEADDLAALATRHKLRITRLDQRVIVTPQLVGKKPQGSRP
jgi:hypothetical protein